ncbi:MAG: hypothetical protein XD91_0262 [Clostridiales bacterium 38_11]|nr:MAG: hypothetical protein XD91_0262 [Clostridiales bacterium 38_11]
MKKTLSVLLTVVGLYFMWLGLYALVGLILLPFSFAEPYLQLVFLPQLQQPVHGIGN